ncbi:MAG: EamA family transporter, partial [Gemmatirosa sp.]
ASFTARSVGALLYLAFVGGLAGFGAYIYVLSHLPVSFVSLYAYVNPVVAVLLGWAIGGEPIGPRTIAASAVIVAAVALITVGRTRATP